MTSTAPDPIPDDHGAGPAPGQKFLTFRLGAEEYGVQILQIREIIGMIDITPLPRTPDFIRGVVNLRGKIIPVMELRTRFGLESIPFDDETCIVVVEVIGADDEQFQMGVIVDAVSEVLDIAAEQVEPAPKFGCQLDTDFILGMGRMKERVITLLAIDRVLTREIIEGLATATGTESGGEAPLAGAA